MKSYYDIYATLQLPVSYKAVRFLKFICSFVFIVTSYKQLHEWKKSVTVFNSLFPVRFLMSFSPQDLFKMQSNKHFNLLLLITSVIKH